MRNRFIGAFLTTALVPAMWAQAGAAKQAPRQTAKAVQPATIMGHPNFNGIWFAQGTAMWDLEAHSAQDMGDRFFRLGAMAAIPAGKSYLKGGGSIPYTPAGLAKRNENKKNAPEYDPEAKCYMLGVPRVTYSGMPFQIIQGTGGSGNLAGDMIMVYPFDATNRVINMTDHSEAPIDSWMGKSDGHWEGNTLVVETKYQYDKTWLDRAGNHHSADMKVTEKIQPHRQGPHALRGHHRRPQNVHEAVDDRNAPLSHDRRERADHGTQVRALRRQVAVSRSDPSR
jgi:hypothetical protein